MTVLLLAGVLIGFVARVATPRSKRDAPRVCCLWLLAMAALCLILARLLGVGGMVRAAAVGTYLVTNALLAVWCLLNLRVRGMTLLLVGLLMNFTVVLVNGGMPVDAALSGSSSSLYVQMHGARLWMLGDWIPMGQAARLLGLASPGDIVMALAAGVITWGLPLSPSERGNTVA